MGKSSGVLDLQNITIGELRRIIEYINDNQSTLDKTDYINIVELGKDSKAVDIEARKLSGKNSRKSTKKAARKPIKLALRSYKLKEIQIRLLDLLVQEQSFNFSFKFNSRPQ